MNKQNECACHLYQFDVIKSNLVAAVRHGECLCNLATSGIEERNLIGEHEDASANLINIM